MKNDATSEEQTMPPPGETSATTEKNKTRDHQCLKQTPPAKKNEVYSNETRWNQPRVSKNLKNKENKQHSI